MTSAALSKKKSHHWEAPNSDLVGCTVAKRFGIRQGTKIRVIDDCSCGLNGSVGLREKFGLHSVDQLASMIAHSFNINPLGHAKMLGRTYDLKSAYKQFPLAPGDRSLPHCSELSFISSCQTLEANMLPFGAVGSVSGFLCVSMAVWYVGLRGLSIYWSAFYDDFSVVTSTSLENSTAWACESLFKLLGLKFAEDGPKCQPFSSSFKMLGVVMDLSKTSSLRVDIGHTPERSKELAENIRGHLQTGTISSKEAERLRGRMIFFEGFALGRVACSAVKSLGRCVDLKRHCINLDKDMLGNLEF